MNLTANASSHHETLPSETRNDDYTMTCFASRDEMNALGYTVTLCGNRLDRHSAKPTGHASHAIPCPICNAILSDPAFRNELISYCEKHIRPYCGGGDDSHTATD